MFRGPAHSSTDPALQRPNQIADLRDAPALQMFAFVCLMRGNNCLRRNSSPWLLDQLTKAHLGDMLQMHVGPSLMRPGVGRESARRRLQERSLID